jgi:beta-fructofuranosidase
MTISNKKINETYRHKYHLMPEQGWMNDPNGFSVFNEEYHLFYQHYPYSTEWGPMHWAHAVSSDLIKWKHLDIALKPGEEYDRNGIFSGSGIQVGKEHWLYYTGHIDTNLDHVYGDDFKKKKNAVATEENPYIRQVQCLATSTDGVNYKKYDGNPVISTEQIPGIIKPEDFRDPKVWKHNGRFYLVVGARSKGGIGYVLFYVSDDGMRWEYLNYLSLGKEYGSVWECPDLFELSGKFVLLFSPQEKPRMGNRFENVHSAMAFIGSFDHASGEFIVEQEQELDQGFDFYAPQSVLTMDGKRVLLAWMNMWEMKYPLHELEHGWNGSMTLPRELVIENGRLLQKPYHTIENYQKYAFEDTDFEINGEYQNSKLRGTCQKLELLFEMKNSQKLCIELFKGNNEYISLTFEKECNEMTLNRGASAYPIESIGTKNDFVRSMDVDLQKCVTLTMFLDISSVEIFINNGEQVCTSLFFSKELGEKVLFHSEGTTYIHKLTKWDIV